MIDSRALQVRGNLLLATLLVLCPQTSSFAPPKARPADKPPADTRLGELRDLDSHFAFQPPATVAEWNERRSQLRQRLQVVLGLWPMPTASSRRCPETAARFCWSVRLRT